MSHLSSVKWLNGDTNHAADMSMVMTVGEHVVRLAYDGHGRGAC